MSKDEKSIERLLSRPKDFHYNEAKAILFRFGFKEFSKGKTSGSRVEFIRGKDSISLHKPHPNGELKSYQIKQIIDFLRQLKLI